MQVIARKDVAASVGDAGDGKWQMADGKRQRDHAGAADQELDVGLFEPAFGFAGLEFEAGDGFDGVAGGQDFGVLGIEFLGKVHGAGEGAAGFFVETGTDGFDGVGQEGIKRQVGVEDGEAGFDCTELGEHGAAG